jgi:glycosyltransferase involved in cell wall biosynthesis
MGVELKDYSVSIVVPTYEYGGKACALLDQCLGSIDAQTYRNFEVVVIDHSKDSVIEEYLSRWSFPVRYRRNERGRGNSSVNMNEGIADAQGEIIKVMHMDDWFCNPQALQKMVDGLRDSPLCAAGTSGPGALLRTLSFH